MSDIENENWERSNLQVFWGEIAPCDHVVQIYQNEKVFFETLEGFAGSGLISGDSVLIIATAQHLYALEARLKKQGFDIDQLSADEQYVGIEVEKALSKFMINNWPDREKFNDFIMGLLERTKHNNRKVRAFGEMVAVLWEQGFNGATVQLENLWNQLHDNDQFTLFCAYPRIGFTQDIKSSVEMICSAHSKVIDGSPRPSTEIYYR